MVNENPVPQTKSFADGFRNRCKDIKTTRWVRFGIVALIYLLWVIWLDNYWFLLGLPLLFDIYITGYIPFTWWKKSKNAVVRQVMSWIDAIVYALILAYFLFCFVGQNYEIPSSSLEKTMLIGDYVWVNKAVYGPRVPVTPIHFPLTHNTWPVVGGNSYASWPENGYRRLPGLRNVERNDIVVFNFPAGDTVATRFEQAEDPRYYEQLVEEYGWQRVNTDKATFGDIIYRPVDRRTNFVKRAVGLPGERLKIVSDTIYINGRPLKTPKNAQFSHLIAADTPLDAEVLRKEGIAVADVQQADGEFRQYLAAINPVFGTAQYLYAMPLTTTAAENLRRQSGVLWVGKALDFGLSSRATFPKQASRTWSLSDYGGDNGILIPKKGMTVPMNAATWDLYNRVIRNYERHTDSWLDGNTVYIDGKPAGTYTFAMDYYFMMGDNRDLSQDSRFWGFVPEDHIVGTPVLILASFDRERPWTDGKIRWNRILRRPNPDK